jgi:hypothetical protein
MGMRGNQSRGARSVEMRDRACLPFPEMFVAPPSLVCGARRVRKPLTAPPVIAARWLCRSAAGAAWKGRRGEPPGELACCGGGIMAGLPCHDVDHGAERLMASASRTALASASRTALAEAAGTAPAGQSDTALTESSHERRRAVYCFPDAHKASLLTSSPDNVGRLASACHADPGQIPDRSRFDLCCI